MSCMMTIFNEFEKKNIEYIHFKSNCHLDDSFLGNGDFDILINPRNLGEVEKVLIENKGKQCNSFFYGRYPGVDNWLIFDDETGDIKHFHLHCQLVTGKALVKEYVVPWAEIMLKTRTRDPKWGIYVSDPNMEILLLLVRSVVKSTYRDRIKATFGRYTQHKDLREEWIELHKIINAEIVEQYVEDLFPLEHQEEIKKIVLGDKISSKDFRKLHSIVRSYLNINRRIGGNMASICSLMQRFFMKIYRYMNSHFDSCHLIKKTGLTSGAIIAFVGVDGAGKSATTKEIQKWLQRKMECHRFYMGEGDGKSTLLVSIMKKFQVKGSGETKKNVVDLDKEQNREKIVSFKYLKKHIRARMILSIEKRNYLYLIRMNKYRLNGGISLLDRYPQLECEGKNDGPKINGLFNEHEKTKFTERLITREKKYLSIVKQIKPDVVFRLNITADESMRRKPEQRDTALFQSKIDELARISFQNADIIDIDATQEYEQELLEIKRKIWEII